MVDQQDEACGVPLRQNDRTPFHLPPAPQLSESNLPLFGSHLSIASGFHKTAEKAAMLGLDTVQTFTLSPSQWVVKSVDAPEKADSRSGRFFTRCCPV